MVLRADGEKIRFCDSIGFIGTFRKRLLELSRENQSETGHELKKYKQTSLIDVKFYEISSSYR